MTLQISISLGVFLLLFHLVGCEGNRAVPSTDEAPAVAADDSEHLALDKSEIEGEFDFDRVDRIREVETKKINWNLIPEAEKTVRTTTGKIVYQSADGRLIVSHYVNGSPRFAIRQFRPDYLGKSSFKLWITDGVQEAWTPEGTHVRFYAEDTIPFGTWVVSDSEGQTQITIGFENLKHTGELEMVTFPSPIGGRPGLAMYDSETGTWNSQPEVENRIAEVENVVKMIREFLSIVDQG